MGRTHGRHGPLICTASSWKLSNSSALKVRCHILLLIHQKEYGSGICFSVTRSFDYLNAGAVPKKILQMMNVDYLTREIERVLQAISRLNFYLYASFI
jgi:hypothetical protein